MEEVGEVEWVVCGGIVGDDAGNGDGGVREVLEKGDGGGERRGVVGVARDAEECGGEGRREGEADDSVVLAAGEAGYGGGCGKSLREGGEDGGEQHFELREGEVTVLYG